MTNSTTLPHKLMLVISAVQGLLLFALYKAFDTNFWPSESPIWSYPLWTVAIVAPLLMLLSLERDNIFKVIKYSFAFCSILFLLAIYIGWQAEPFDEFAIFSLSFAFAASITLAAFKALMYLQQRAASLPMSYKVLFTFSWRNFLVTALSALLVLIFWLVLLLWGSLFDLIGVSFFQVLFRYDWFLFPVLASAFGVGTIIFRNLTHVIDSISKLLHGLIKLLLPLIILVAVIFLVSLPFVGLDVLWATKRGTALLLWLLAIILFFINAVYQDGREVAPYSDLVHKLIYIGLWSLVFLCGLSLYGLLLRINQYGWTIERCWALLTWLVLTLFSIGYVWGVIRYRSDWPNTLARVNTVMGLVILGLMLLVNSPILDFRKISLNSQLSRVESGEIELKELDFHYIKRNLARPGYLELEQLKNDYRERDPEVVKLIERGRPYKRAAQNSERFWNHVIFRPSEFEVPSAVKKLVEGTCNNSEHNQIVFLKLDLDNDAQDEYLVIQSSKTGSYQYISISKYYYLHNDVWHVGDLNNSNLYNSSSSLNEKLKEGQIETVKKRFNNIKIGDFHFQPNEENLCENGACAE